MVKKYKKFCNGNGGNGATGTVNGGENGKKGASGKNGDNITETWTCYYKKKNENNDGKKEINFCVLQDGNQHTKDRKDKSYNAFFWDWVHDMLIHSIKWRNELGNCINKDNDNTCKKKNKCNNDCKCFLKWVNEKKKEWTEIKIHFGKQDFGTQGENGAIDMLGELMRCPSYVLKTVLEKDLLLEIIEGTYGKSKETEAINKILDDEEAAVLGILGGVFGDFDTGAMCGTGSANGKNSIIDKLLNREENDATKCQKDCQEPQKPQEQATSDVARSATGTSPQTPDQQAPPSDEEEEEEEEEEDDAEDAGGGGEVEEEEKQEVVEVKEGTEEQQPPTTTVVDVCATVAEALKGKLDDACTLKYSGNNSRLGWKCIPSGKPGDTGSSGAICVPPRRRRLYVTPLTKWAETVAQPQESGGNTESSDKLREAFIQSAAVETFFLWHRYKKEWEHRNNKTQDGGSQLLQLPGAESDDNDPQTLLQSGKIPPDFLRQMFYTLGDYRDIFFGKDVVDETKGISEKIKDILEKANGGTPPSDKNPNEKREQFWKQHGKDIWQGMVCALTYTDSGDKDKPPEVDKKVKEAFFGTPNGKPGTTSTQNGTFKDKYDYEKVTLENSETEAISNDTLNNPKLTQFVLRPPYFRYLEEWGETFCRERKKRLEKIEEECMDGKTKKCSGDGENCKDIRTQDYSTVRDFNCPGCGKYCRFYKKWISAKKNEFEKQKSAYEQQKEKCQTESESAKNNKDYKQFCGTPETTSPTAGDFLNRLKSGPCKTDNENGEGDIDFNNQSKTFKHTNLCDPCSLIGAKCKSSDCSGGGTKVECKDNKITAEKIGNGVDSTVLDMRVSDDSKSGFNDDGLQACEHAGIFTGIRKEEWKCGKVCGVDICYLKGDNQKNHDKKNILIRALLKRWVENFLEDYNKINGKISHCTNTVEGSKCISGCEEKCKCVEEWIKLKQQEWPKIRDRYVKQYKGAESDMKSSVKNFLEDLQSQIDFKSAIKPCGDLRAFERSIHCNGAVSSENDIQKDVVECLLDKLEDKAKECKEDQKPNGENPETKSQNTHHVGDEDDEPMEGENPENKVGHPQICKDVLPEPKPEEKDTCDDANPPSTEPKQSAEEENADKKSGSEASDTLPGPAPPGPPATTEPEEKAAPAPSKEKPNPEQTPILKPEEEAPPPEASEPNKEETPPVPPTLSDQPTNSIGDILSSTIPFGIAIALTSIVFFLKKKTKSTIDLLRVINIPKSDYDIPTKLSPNRYIPYTSGKYRGKRYIYLEGDSGTDSGYTDHYSDITSSSESEYEELDINDIYVPHAPKYKTLIEVVLEPSGKLSGNTIPTSDKNTPSDTQNDIQNDGIPSSKITDNEWNTLKDEFISNMLQNEPNTEPNILRDNVDNNTHPTTSRHNIDQKPFITSIHDRDLYSGEEYNYDMSTNSGNNDLYNGKNNLYSGIDPTSDNRGLTSGKHDSYSGIDLINDSLSGDYDIYDEMLKRKENELFGTNHVKQTSIHSVAKPARDDPIHNQLELFHKWLDRHRDMCEKWENHHERLAKLKEKWENDTSTSGNTHPSESNKTLNTDVSIQIDMDHGKPKKEFTNMDTNMDTPTMHSILDDLEKYNEPYYDVQDDIYYDVNDHDTSTVDTNAMDVPSKVQIEMDINTKLVKEKYPIADVWDI
ncbi:PfEMP1 [Plasmodium falciparum Dd2]|uniref:PfEMP1 n=1 Tax=Plasmodium falciparum (isolate Dd2) TaxID=57267 RepID=A0A0L7LWG1_PLAF4|nr:PfEMP1 [Plasmodium falciparum Dd2]